MVKAIDCGEGSRMWRGQWNVVQAIDCGEGTRLW